MRPNIRSTSGALLMLVIIPIFAGLLACMPVPIGDPERSRIDADISGVWASNVDDNSGALYLFQPWDKRTWLLAGAEIGEGPSYEGESFDVETMQDAMRVLETHDIGEDGITTETTILYKVWLTKLGGVQFMTWAPVGRFDSDGSHAPEYWFVFKVVKTTRDEFELYFVDSDHDVFEDIEKRGDYEGDDYAQDMRRTWERALKRAAKNEEIYGEDPWTFRRLPDDLMDKASDLFGEVIESD